jgi:transposase
MRSRLERGYKYLTLVCDLDAGTVEYLADDRQQGNLDGYYQGLSEEQRQGIEAVAMDIWNPYIASTKSYVPEAEEKIVFDRYHLMTHMGKAVDTVRIARASGVAAGGRRDVDPVEVSLALQ